MMTFEHMALNVPDAKQMARWYVVNCKMNIRMAVQKAPFTHFLADSTGRVVLEIYSNTSQPFPDYAVQHSLLFHFAYAVEDPAAHCERLIKAGARQETDQTLPDGSRIILMRDPWGIPFQLCKRAAPFRIE